MIRLMYLLRRKAGLTASEFRDHWLGHHVERYGDPIQAIRQYVLYSALLDQPRAGAGSHDGVASVWFDDEASLERTMNAAMPAASIDEKRFIDHDRSTAYLVRDDVVVEPDWPSPVVLIECYRRSGEAPPERSVKDEVLLTEHVRSARALGVLAGCVRSDVQQHPTATGQFDRLSENSERCSHFLTFYFQSAVLARDYLSTQSSLPPLVDPVISDSERLEFTLLERHCRRYPVR
jgi:hypothetical protein